MARFDKLEFESDDEAINVPDSKNEDFRLSTETNWLQLAEQNRRDGNYESALRFYSRALELDRNIVSGWIGQCQMLIMLDEYQQALIWSHKSLEMFPNNADLLAAQAQAQVRRGETKKSNELIDASSRVKGETAYQWQVRGELMIALRQKTDRHCFDKAQICSSDVLVPLESAVIYMHYKEFAKAQQRAMSAAERAPDLAYAWYILGQCQEATGLTAAAKRSYRQCIEVNANHQLAKSRLHRMENTRPTLFGLLKGILRR